MKHTYKCNYNYLIKHFESLDNQDTHILLSLSDDINNNETIVPQLLSKIRHMELSILVDNSINITNSLIQYCNANKILIYYDIKSEEDCSDALILKTQTLIALIDINLLISLNQNILKKISNSNIHICLLHKNDDSKKIAHCHNILNTNGFVNLLHATETLSSKEYSSIINRELLSTFNSIKNFKTRDEINKISLSALKRYNNSLSQNPKEQTQIVFVNLNLSPDYINRKNLGIEYLASVLNTHGYCTKCLYSHRLQFLNEIENIINSSPSIKVIGFSCMQDNINAVQNSINHLKKKYPNLIFIIGGAQATALGQEYISANCIDYVMVGESEKSIIPLMNYIFYGKGVTEKIPGIRFLNKDGLYTETPQVELIENLDTVPFPLYVFEKDDTLRHAGIITGRGCPFNCSFCYEGAKEKTVRFRSLSNVFEEISLLVQNKKNLKVIQFYDDTFTISKERVLAFCEKFQPIYDKYHIEWACEIHCQNVYKDPQIITQMVNCGLVDAQIGLESGNADILKKFNKQISLDMILSTIDICKNAGLKRLEGNILLGGAGETQSQLEEQFALAEELLRRGRGIFELNLALFWPYPNTPITKAPEKYGVKILPDQCNYTINTIKNFVTESHYLSRQHFIDHFYKLSEKIISLYDSISLEMTASEILSIWGKEIFSARSKWAHALIRHPHINIYLTAKFNNDIKFDSNVYPIRTFDLISYDGNNCIFFKDANIVFSVLASRILELCNGKNTVSDIAEKLHLSHIALSAELQLLEEKMFVYYSLI